AIQQRQADWCFRSHHWYILKADAVTACDLRRQAGEQRAVDFVGKWSRIEKPAKDAKAECSKSVGQRQCSVAIHNCGRWTLLSSRGWSSARTIDRISSKFSRVKENKRPLLRY